ncbi:hypothetical protein KGA66_22135, partial [Actinocrinis puniceicyclus]
GCMSDVVRQWRPSTAGRVAAALVTAMYWLLSVVTIAVAVNGGISVPWLLLCLVVFAWPAAEGVGYAFRYRIILSEDELTIVGLRQITRLPLALIVRAHTTSLGIVFVLSDGRRRRARGVETSRYQRWSGDYTRADELIDAVLAAADHARDAHAAHELSTPAATDPPRKVASARPRAVQLTLLALLALMALMALSLALIVHLVADDFGSIKSTSTTKPRYHPVFKLGDCLQDPAAPDDNPLVPVSCTKSHTAQIYAISSATAFSGCDDALLDQSALPGIVSHETMTLSQNGVGVTACLIVTQAVTRSLINLPPPPGGTSSASAAAAPVESPA